MDRKKYLLTVSAITLTETIKAASAVVRGEPKCTCPICEKSCITYLPYGIYFRKNAKCPYCKSLERHRTLWSFLRDNSALKLQSLRVLHIAPEQCLMLKLKELKNLDYYPCDLDPGFPGIREVVDVTNIPFEDCFFDLILCNHVLEHVQDDRKAMEELYRVLKKDAYAILNVPINHELEETLENPAYNTKELREKYYGQADHVRYYGKDYADRLRSAGFMVDIVYPNITISDKDLRINGLIRDDEIFICWK